MGTGVGEAMLIGAAVGATAGGAGAAIQGGDPLKGALTGGAMGAVGGGLGAGFGAAGGTASGGATGLGSSSAAGSFGSLTGAGTGAVGGGTLGVGTGAVGGSSLGAGSSVLAGGANPALYGSLGTGAGSFGGIGAGAGALPTTFAPLSTGITSASSAIPIGTLSASAPSAISSGIGAGSSVVSPSTMALAGTGPGNFTGMAPALSNANLGLIGGGSLLSGMMQAERNQYGVPGVAEYESSFDPSKFSRSEPTYAPEGVYRPEYKNYRTAAEGGIMKLANGGPVERMTAMNTAINPQGGLYPQGMIDKTQYAVPTQRPASLEMLETEPSYQRSNPLVGVAGMAEGGIAGILEAAKAQGLSPEMYQNIYGRGNAIIEMQKALKEGKTVNMADGGISSLGGYSDGGRMLKGPGDGMSDSIPGVIGGKQPARLADGEFVVPADVVSHLGNGSTDAGAKQLYSMMDKVRKARTGKKAQGKQINPRKYMPA